jgi:predicted transcriptional regulator
MDESTLNMPTDHIELTADIVSAFVSNNPVPVSELANLLTSVHTALSGLAAGGSAASQKDEVEKPTPAQIKKSITPDALISFEDGKPYKTLRRHLTLGLGNSRKSQTKAAAKAAEPEETVSAASAEAKPKRAGRPRKAAAAE